MIGIFGMFYLAPLHWRNGLDHADTSLVPGGK